MKYLGQPQSGSRADITAGRNRFGQYYRTKSIPVNPVSPKQAAIRQAFAELARTWRTLTNEQRASWGTLGDQLKKKDSLGQVYSLTGLQIFQSFNMVRKLISLEPLTTAPVFGTTWTPVLDNVAAEPGELHVSLATAAPPQKGLLIYASPPQSAGRHFNKQYRFMGFIPESEDNLDFTTAYIQAFGAPLVGQAVWVRMLPIDYTGQVGSADTVRVIVSNQ